MAIASNKRSHQPKEKIMADEFLRPLTEVLRDLKEAQRFTKYGTSDYYWYEDEIKSCEQAIAQESSRT